MVNEVSLPWTDELPAESPLRLQREAYYASGDLDVGEIRKILADNERRKVKSANQSLFEWLIADYERWRERTNRSVVSGGLF